MVSLSSLMAEGIVIIKTPGDRLAPGNRLAESCAVSRPLEETGVSGSRAVPQGIVTASEETWGSHTLSCAP